MDDTKELEERLARVEKELEELKAAPKRAPRVVAAMVLNVAAAGVHRGGMAALDDGSSFLTLCDSHGAARLLFGMAGEKMAWLGLVDGAGKRRAEVRLTPEGTPAIALQDAKAVLRLRCDVEAKGAALGLCDGEGNARAAVLVSEEGHPVIGTV
jgi:hypothetical protein